MIDLSTSNGIKKIEERLMSHFGEKIKSSLDVKTSSWSDLFESERITKRILKFEDFEGKEIGSVESISSFYVDDLEQNTILKTNYSFSGPLSILNKDYLLGE